MFIFPWQGSPCFAGGISPRTPPLFAGGFPPRNPAFFCGGDFPPAAPPFFACPPIARRKRWNAAVPPEERGANRELARRRVEASTVPFQDPEEAWFWHCRNEAARADGGGGRWRHRAAAVPRPCEPLEVAMAVQRLFMNRRLSREHLRVLAKYGRTGHAPGSGTARSCRDLALWLEAMERLGLALQAKGIVDAFWLPPPETLRSRLLAGPLGDIRAWRADTGKPWRPRTARPQYPVRGNRAPLRGADRGRLSAAAALFSPAVPAPAPGLKAEQEGEGLGEGAAAFAAAPEEGLAP